MTLPSKMQESVNASGTAITVPPLNVISTKAIRPEIQAFWETLSAKETVSVFVNLFKLLWNLTIRLLTVLSLFLLVFAVVLVWFWSVCYQGGRAFKQIFITDNDELGGAQIVNGLARLVLIPAKILANWVEYQVKMQFGKDFEVPLPDLDSQVWPYPSKAESDTAKKSESESKESELEKTP